MLAYVFWHWPQSTIDRQVYEEHLVSFHSTLKAYRPDGFKWSAVFLTSDMPWIGNSSDAYEEWYLLDDSAAMDKLNHAAVSGACEEPHNRVAREAAGGVAGLYRLRAGKESLSKSRVAMWFAKPNGVSYSHLHSTLQPICAEEGVALWGRQMTLGPTTEYCIHSHKEIRLPPGFEEVKVTQRLIWSGRSEVR